MNLPNDFAPETLSARPARTTRRKLTDMHASIDQWESVTVDVNFPT